MLRILLTGYLMVFSLAAMAAPKADLWKRWTEHDAQSTTTIEHQAWDSFLKKYIVDDDGLHRVRYAAVGNADKKSLDDYIASLEATAISNYNRDEQLAFWINLYNAATVMLILDNFPVDSITDIKSGLLSFGPWDKKLLTVEGEKITLNDIEHRILRPIWKNPLIHYAVNCASVGCPNLAKDAYTTNNAWKLAEANARAYIKHPRGVTIEGGKLKVSSIFIWFKSDFGGTEKTVIEHLRKYAEPGLSKELTDFRKIDSHDYNWDLNETQ